VADSSPSLIAVVLGAGAGTRMRSTRPKPLHKLCGKPLVTHVVDALADLGPERVVVVVGHGSDEVTAKLGATAPQKLTVDFVTQERQLGTGDATMTALNAINDDFGYGDADGDSDVIIMPGDTPLVRPQTLMALLAAHRDGDAAGTVLSARLANPTGYGRVVRHKDGRVQQIVEESDATPEIKAIDEINTGIYVFKRSVLGPALRRTSPDNKQGEFYLTDVVEVLSSAGYWVASMQLLDATEAMGVNDRVQLAAAESEMRQRINTRWLTAGVTLMDPSNTYIDATVELQSDVTIFPGSWLQGHTVVCTGAQIGPNTRLVEATVGERAIVESSVVRHAAVAADQVVGPFAVIDPNA
jgi:bifunctional UDP-N-acetylglucosamine pyrophosphorylase/glucosamine-1-phosphate N-acetyltransferase